jgi:hypothetical protein
MPRHGRSLEFVAAQCGKPRWAQDPLDYLMLLRLHDSKPQSLGDRLSNLYWLGRAQIDRLGLIFQKAEAAHV